MERSLRVIAKKAIITPKKVVIKAFYSCNETLGEIVFLLILQLAQYMYLLSYINSLSLGYIFAFLDI